MQAETNLFRARIIATVAATFVSLACGSNYVYSAWAPQFAQRLKLSSTESNMIGLWGNLGMYSLGVPVGMIVDHRGSRPAVVAGAALMAIGYLPLYAAYNKGSGSVVLFCLFSFLSGLGGCMAFASAVKTAALNWPFHRGTATAFPLAAFGLSAFFFSFLGSVFFPGDPSGFLLLLGIGSSSFTLMGFFFLKVHPVPSSQSRYTPLPHSDLDRYRHNEGAVPMRRLPPKDPRTSHSRNSSINNPAGSSSNYANSHDTEEDHFLVSDDPLDDSHEVDIRGLKLMKDVSFWQFFLIMAILAGVGLMTINNIGNDSKALWEHYDPTVDQKFLVARQQMHVSVLSICSFLGRLSSGVGSDWLVKKLRASRVWCLVIATVIFFIAQLCALIIENPHFLILVSSLSGLGYGFLFGVFPSIVAERFGIRGLSQNWGFITMAPTFSSNVFNLFYGRVYDEHSTVQEGGERMCMDGLACYKPAYWVTFVACCIGMGVCLWAMRYMSTQSQDDGAKGGDED